MPTRDADTLVATATLPDAGEPLRAPKGDPLRPVLEGSPAEARYEPPGELIGKGGMGAVWDVADKLVGRHVALKFMQAASAALPEQRAMFLREARVQGQLEHPAIVPVYDIGFDATGAAYFTMKRVHGRTLAEVIADVRRDPSTHSPRRLLTALASVCLAVDFAHRRGVVHRDLKPSNIMLGEFGEVHVLDWGVCRVLGDERSGPTASASDNGDRTRAAGTPGYMAPEQALGVSIGFAADIYALGAIVFEALTLRRLADSNGIIPAGALTAELASICARATADDPADRYLTARAVADEIEAYLDGERSIELRRQMAAQHLDVALTKLGDSSEPARRMALRSVGRALALEPEDPNALNTLYQLLAEPPRETPSEVKAEIAAQQRAQQTLTARTSALGYAGMLLFLPVLLWIGVRDWLALCLFLGAAAVAAIISLTRRPTLWIVAASTLAFALGSTMYGPLVLVPTMIATNTMALSLHLAGRARRIAIVIAVCGIVMPMLLTVTRAYASSPDGLLIRPHMLELPVLPTLAFLSIASAVAVVTGARSAGEVRDALAVAEERLLVQRWLLRQLLPEQPVSSTPQV